MSTSSRQLLKKKNKKAEAQESIFNVAAKNRFRDFEEGTKKLTKAFSFRDIPTNDEEPGLYCKYPRITLMEKKNDALRSITADYLIRYMKNRPAEEHKPLAWVDIQGTQDELKDIVEAFGLHPLTLEECTVYDTREKVALYNNYIFLIIHDISLPGNSGVNLNMIIFPDLLLTIHEKPVHSIYDVVPKLEHCYDTEIPSIEFVVHVILSSVISFYEAGIDQIRQKADLLDEEVLEASRVDKRIMSDLLGRLTTTLKVAASLHDNIAIKADLLGSLVRHTTHFTPKGLRYLKSAHDHILKMDLQIGLVHDILSDVNELYMAKISVQLAVAANEVGYLTRQFAVISAIFLPSSLVAGILGMNVNMPDLANSARDDITPFVYIMIFMVACSAVQLYLYKVMKWL